MGCNCKNVKKIQNLIPNANHSNGERKGINKVLYSMLDKLHNIWIKILMTIVLIIAVPIVCLILVINLFFQGKPTIKMPKKIVKSLLRNKNES